MELKIKNLAILEIFIHFYTAMAFPSSHPFQFRFQQSTILFVRVSVLVHFIITKNARRS